MLRTVFQGSFNVFDSSDKGQEGHGFLAFFPPHAEPGSDAALPWYEEYPTSPPTFTLNGFMYSLLGLADLRGLLAAMGEVEGETVLAVDEYQEARDEAEYLFKVMKLIKPPHCSLNCSINSVAWCP